MKTCGDLTSELIVGELDVTHEGGATPRGHRVTRKKKRLQVFLSERFS